MIISDNLTEESKRLFDALQSQGLNIELEVRPDLKEKLEGAWGIIPTYKIVSEDDIVNPAAFAHELLHIHLFTINFKDSDIIFKEINNPTYLFSRDFLLATNNNLAHFKMVEEFQKLGFDRSNFFGTTLEFQLEETSKHIKEIDTVDKNSMMQEFINAYSSMRLLKEYFSMDTTTLENDLQVLDNKFFKICDEEFTKWINAPNADNLKLYTSLKFRLIYS